jgi:hypothetical protein
VQLDSLMRLLTIALVWKQHKPSNPSHEAFDRLSSVLIRLAHRLPHCISCCLLVVVAAYDVMCDMTCVQSACGETATQQTCNSFE